MFTSTSPLTTKVDGAQVPKTFAQYCMFMYINGYGNVCISIGPFIMVTQSKELVKGSQNFQMVEIRTNI